MVASITIEETTNKKEETQSIQTTKTMVHSESVCFIPHAYFQQVTLAASVKDKLSSFESLQVSADKKKVLNCGRSNS